MGGPLRNCTLTVLGQKGSGKTTFVRWLVAQSSRVIIVDRFMEYEDGAVTANFDEAVDYLAKNWRGRFRLVVRFSKDLYYRELFNYVVMCARRCPTIPISLVLEEADFFADSHGIEPAVDYIYRYGRHWRLNLVAVARGATDLNKSLLTNTDCVVAFRTRKLSSTLRDWWHADQLQEMMRLETLTPGTMPVKGTHYLTYPDDADPLALWRAVQPESGGLELPPARGVAIRQPLDSKATPPPD